MTLSARFLRPHSFLSLFEKEKNRRGVRRSQLHSVSAGAAKTPYPLAPSSFPNCDRFTGSQFGFREFCRAARDLDDGAQAAARGYATFYQGRTPLSTLDLGLAVQLRRKAMRRAQRPFGR